MTTPNESENSKKELLRKIPQLQNKNARIGLKLNHFKKLSDHEFTILWYMPGMDIDIDAMTQIYIEARRMELGLKVNQFAGYKVGKGKG